MSELVLGPMLRYVGASEATVWVETSATCEVEILGCRSRTFRVRGYHYALVHVTGLESGGVYEYRVRLDGRVVWPEESSGFPPPAIRPFRDDGALKLTFGSCRISAPHEPPYNLSHRDDERGLGVDALHATALAAARRLRDGEPGKLPDVLVLLGDQIYAHKPPFNTMEFIRSRRNPEHEPGEVVADFEEYARIYRDSWGEEAIRWLLSTVPSAMIFDDHELDDDWNISESWVDQSRLKP
ncbi:MAG: alkaline phosphatase D family protein [Rubrobacter sp.]